MSKIRARAAILAVPAAAVVLGLAGCGSDKTETQDDVVTQDQVVTETTPAPAPTGPTGNTGSTGSTGKTGKTGANGGGGAGAP